MTIINSKGDSYENENVLPEKEESLTTPPQLSEAEKSSESDTSYGKSNTQIIENEETIERLMPIGDRASTRGKRSLFSEIKLAPCENEGMDGESDPAQIAEGDAIENEEDGEKKKVRLASVKNMFEKIPFGKKNAIVVASLALICGALAINYAITGGDNRTYYDYAGSENGGDASLVGADTSAENLDASAGGEEGNAENVGASGEEGSENVGAEQSSDAYFSAAAVERRRARDESLEVLQVVLDSEDALQESKDSALQSMAKIAAQIEQESNIESLIKAKGFEECIAVVGDEGATVIVSSDGLLANEVAQITEIMCEQTSLPASEITIVEKALG